ncbi:L-type lectin-domain containing receptor kinase S.4-like [Humulus lupulus]|uniref:L-type lectin-domain containing receptor kinase S.4-like n=1 Tax=Humulus lupulus TaxID=3486 RepID=UPI002B40573A|nr:L-type lectin-domain containing receptor kinase S.4-like [Humulus lupulus]
MNQSKTNMEITTITRAFLLFSVFFVSASSQFTDLFYPGFKEVAATNNLTLTGVAQIQTNGILKLTNDSRRLIGRAVSGSKIRLKNSTDGKAFSFSTSFAFTIVPEYPKLGGHGFAFTIVPSIDTKGLPSQYLGIFNASDTAGNFSNHIFAVEFDTVQDFEFGDINDNHVGIDINSLNSTYAETVSYFDDNDPSKRTNFSLNGKAIQAWIDYDSAKNLLNVSVAPFSKKPKNPLLSVQTNLTPIFQEFMYVGFSASTGLLASSHYVLGWSFKVNGQARALDMASLASLPGPKKSHTAMAIGTAASATVVLISAILIAVYLFYKIKNADPIEKWELELGPHRYSYKELKKATKGFREKELLGYGGFGRVYKGTIPKSKIQVAVKRVSHESKQGLREFVAEIASIGRLRHRNLVQLLGWCRRRGDLLLVYDFMSNGSLDKYIFDKPKTILNWEQRIKIIKGVASALLYLHEGFEQVVLHRDVKASNVLLDSELNGRLGDFGLARLHDHGSNMSTTRVVGTLGYLAPELPRTGKATTSSDVYAFGALLLEVACGRKPIEPNAPPEELVLVDWVWDYYKAGRVLEVIDRRLNDQYDVVEAVMVVKLGLMCSNDGVLARPSMRQVVRYLEGESMVPGELRAPDDVLEGKKDQIGIGEGFDDFLHSFPSSSFEKLSGSYSFRGNDNNNNSNNSHKDGMDQSFASLSTSPLSLLRHGRGGDTTRFSG